MNMDKPFERKVYPFRPCIEQTAHQKLRHPVVVLGAGPIGLSAAIDLKLKGVPVIIIDRENTVCEGSRAIAYSQRTLEIWNRLGIGQRIAAKAVGWETGKIFYRNDLLYQFNMRAEPFQRTPAFVNLQQYHLEEFLIKRCEELGIEIRWETTLVDLEQLPEGGVKLMLETPAGSYESECDWLIAADGARSTVRRLLGLEFRGKVFDERFLIVDIRMKGDFPAERWFWFDPPFNPGQSALLHMQADNVWRVGMQLGVNLADDFDVEREKSPERVIPRLRAMLGDKYDFELEWASIYTFQCRRLERFVHGNIIFAGDSAHQVSPFGARGANSGVQDIDNLVWKLVRVMRGEAPVALLDTYDLERGQAADENILHSTRATDFITPKSPMSLAFRHAVLTLAHKYEFARPVINSGRLSTPSTYAGSPLSAEDIDAFSTDTVPGAPCIDVPLLHSGQPAWLLDHLGGQYVCVIYAAQAQHNALLATIRKLPAEVSTLVISPKDAPGNIVDHEGLFALRYDARPGTAYLIRPDQHVAGRWRAMDATRVAAMLPTKQLVMEANA